MGHSTIVEEKFVFTQEAKKKIFWLLGAGIIMFVFGLFIAQRGGDDDHAEGHGHVATEQLVASADAAAASEGAEEGEHHGSVTWVKRLYTTLWMNNIYFVGLGIIGLFFVAIQYAAQAGWSSGI